MFVFSDVGLSYDNAIVVVCRYTFGVEVGSLEHSKRVANLKNWFETEPQIIHTSRKGMNRKACHAPMNEATLKIPLQSEENIYKSIQNHNKSSIPFTSHSVL